MNNNQERPTATKIILDFHGLHKADETTNYVNCIDMRCSKCGREYTVDTDVTTEGVLYIFANKLYVWAHCKYCKAFNQQPVGCIVFE